MNWFNVYGLAAVVILLAPNLLYALLCKDAFVDSRRNRAAEIAEQIGRYGCMGTMIFNIPGTWFGFYFAAGELVYLIGNGVLLLLYCLTWIVFRKRRNLTKTLLLSMLPSVLFLFSGILIASVPLMAFAVVFAVSHILISVKNQRAADCSK